MDIENEDENALKKLLLIAKIKEKRRNLGFWGNISNTVALFSSLGALIAALVALNVAKSEHARKIVEAYKSEANLYKTQQELYQLQMDLGNKQKEVEYVGIKLSKLKNEENDLVRQVGAMKDAIDTSKKKEPSGVNIDVRKDGNLFYFTVNTYPPKASVSVYFYCSGFFVFPDNPPDITKCQTALGLEYINKTAPWEFGPVLDKGEAENALWVIVDFGTHKETRYLNLGG